MKLVRNATTHATHEDFSREGQVTSSSNRTFGLVFSAFLLLFGLAPLLRGRPARPWALLLSAAFLGISLGKPDLLQPLNTLWTKLGMRLQKVTNPVVMGLLFFSTLVPVGFLMRLMKNDPMRLRWDSDAKSYWIDPTPRGPQPESMKDQF